MKISEMKRLLQKISKRHGDIECVTLEKESEMFDTVTMVVDEIQVFDEDEQKVLPGKIKVVKFLSLEEFNDEVEALKAKTEVEGGSNGEVSNSPVGG